MPNRPHKVHHVHHPAHNTYFAAMICISIVVIFGFISVFVPWAQKDIAVGQRAFAFPFKTCVVNTFSPVNEETCLDNDFIEPQGVPLTGKNAECKAYILATIAFVFLSVLPGVFSLLIMAYMMEHLWWHPRKWAALNLGILVFVCISVFLTWIFFITYMEMTCVPDSIFPVSPGYSYGFILYMFNTPISMFAIYLGVRGLRQINKYKKEQEKLGIFEDKDAPAYPPPMPTWSPIPLADMGLPGTPTGMVNPYPMANSYPPPYLP